VKRAVSSALEVLAEGLTITDETARGRHGDIPLRRYVPSTTEPRGVPFVWAHGGGFAYGDLDMPESHGVACALAHSGREVVTVDYRRVPMWNIVLPPRVRPMKGIRYPIPVDDLVDAIEHVRRTRKTNVALGGASAGASLAASATLRLSHDGLDVPTSLVFAYGLFHAKLPEVNPELRERIRAGKGGTQFSPSMFEKMTRNYAGSLSASNDAFAFAGGKDLTAFPKTLFVNADRDPLRASGEQFAVELHQADVDVTSSYIDGSTHGFLNEPLNPAFTTGLERITDWLSATEHRR
jgi:acetyl esterase